MATFLEQALSWINSVLGGVSDIALAPLLGLPPLASLLAVSLLTAAAAVFVVARTSDQRSMAATRRGIHAALFEIRLFDDDPRAILRAVGEILRRNLHSVRLSLVPLTWMAIPLAFIVSQLHSFYGYAGLTPGTDALVIAKLGGSAHDPAAASVPLTLDAPREIRVTAEAVRLSGSDEVLWRIVPTTTGRYTLVFRNGETAVTKLVVVSNSMARRSPKRGSGLVDQLLHPAEPPLPDDSVVTAITVTYPARRIGIAGWRAHWIVVYAGLSMLWAVAFAWRFRVTL